MKLTIIVNGEDVDIRAGKSEDLSTVVDKALTKSHNTGRPAEDWDVRSSVGTYLDTARTIEDYRFKEGERLFLSLRVGAGGSGVLAA